MNIYSYINKYIYIHNTACVKCFVRTRVGRNEHIKTRGSGKTSSYIGDV